MSWKHAIRGNGRLRLGITIFDPRRAKAPATRHEPKQFPIGIDYVIVNGQLVIDQGQHTGRLPGRALRRGRSSSV
jgi:N-acyl-D-aspartate/D-glutamate deacylase